MQDALTAIKNGHSAKSFIMDLAVSMRAHAEAGNINRAEEYASEIAILQDAEREAHGLKEHPAPAGQEPWNLSAELWAAVLIGGGYKKIREFHAPSNATPNEVLACAQREFPNRYVGHGDISPQFPHLAIAAE